MWPGVAQRLDLPLHPNLRTAVDLAHHAPGRLDEAIHETGDLAVVAGLANPASSQEVSGHELRGLIDDLGARGYEFLVADLGPLPDTSRLEDFNLLVIVGTANPVGLTRLVRSVERLKAGPHPPLLVVVNRVAVGGHRRGEIRSELNRSLPATPMAFLPSDPRIEASAWNGVITDRGGFHRAIKDMAALLDRASL
jgi:MinD-like ATPase involved in chromosome partitioning or flagellar assembly